MIENLTFITGNKNKAVQVERYLGFDLKIHDLDLVEIQSLNSREIIENKAKSAYQQLETPILVEDISMVIHSLGNLPGPLIKWFLNEMGPIGICRIASLYPDKSAFVEAIVGLYDGKNLQIFSAKVRGNVSDKPKGDRGFGFDEIFIPDGYNLTRSEMLEKDYDKTNHRRKVWQKVERYLTKSNL